VLEKDAKSAAGNGLQHLQTGLAKILTWGKLRSGQFSVGVCLDRGMSCSKRASLFRFRPAPRARHGQDTFQGQLLGFHTAIIHRYQMGRWSILLFLSSIAKSKNQNGTDQGNASQEDNLVVS